MSGSPQVGVSQPRGYGGGNPTDLLDAVRGVLPISSTAVLCCQGRWRLPKQSGGKSLLPREPTCILLCAQEPVSPTLGLLVSSEQFMSRDHNLQVT